MSSVLVVDQINSYYGPSHVLFDLSLTVGDHEVVSLLGRNGAGKTTTMRSVMGLTIPRSGRVVFGGQEVSRTAPHLRARLGLGFVPEGRRIFPDLTVAENLLVAAKSGWGEWSLDRVYELFPDLGRTRNQSGRTLSGGQQQMLTIARALMGNPQFLLLDEVSEGLAPAIVKGLKEALIQLKRSGMSMLLCEQNLAFVNGLSDRTYVLETGEIRYHGETSHLERNRVEWERYITV